MIDLKWLILSDFRAICGLGRLLSLTNLIVASADETTISFGDYPRYRTNVTALDPAIQIGMRSSAMVLVQAVLAGQSVDVMVIGHADFDGKGREFEIGVSRERAAGAESSLETFFSQAADSAALPTDQRKLEFYAQTPEIFKPFLSRYLAGAMFWLVVRSTDRKSLL